MVDNEPCVFLEYMYSLTLKYVSPRVETTYDGEETRSPPVKGVLRKPHTSTLQHTENRTLPYLITTNFRRVR
jgi:hypothetical protein